MSAGIIEVESKTVYGVTQFYPVNEAAKGLALIACTITLRLRDLKTARDQLGFTVVDVTTSKLKGF